MSQTFDVTTERSIVPDPALWPHEPRFHAVDGGRLHYIDVEPETPQTGSPTFLFLHGNPDWSFIYREVIAQISPRARCVAIDYLGFGLSEKPADFSYTAAAHAESIASLVDALALDNIVLVAIDWGGPIGLHVLAERVSRVRGIALGNSFAWPAKGLPMKGMGRVFATKRMQRAVTEGNLMVERILPISLRKKLTEHEMNHYREVVNTPASRAGIARFPIEILEAEELLRSVADAVDTQLRQVPALILLGAKDKVFGSRGIARRWRRLFDDVDVVRLRNAGHYVPEDDPATFADALISRFLDGTRSNAAAQ